MKVFLPAFLFLVSVSVACAYNPILVEPPQPYDVVMIEGDPYTQREYLGDLEDFPDMYEVTSDVAFTLSVQVRQRDTKNAAPFGLIIVKQNEGDGGVTEVARLTEPLSDWQKVSESSLGMSFLESTLVQKEVEPGTYRIEVSTPDNKGSYMLVVGDESYPSNFFKALGQIYMTQQHFGLTPFHMLASSFVLYPIGIIAIICGILYTWKNRRKFKHG